MSAVSGGKRSRTQTHPGNSPPGRKPVDNGETQADAFHHDVLCKVARSRREEETEPNLEDHQEDDVADDHLVIGRQERRVDLADLACGVRTSPPQQTYRCRVG